VIQEIRARGFGDASTFYAFCDRLARQFVCATDLQRALKDLDITGVDARSILQLSKKLESRNGMPHEPQLADLEFVKLFSWQHYYRTDATGVYLGHLPAYTALAEARRHSKEIIERMLRHVTVTEAEGARDVAEWRFYQSPQRPRAPPSKIPIQRRRAGYAQSWTELRARNAPSGTEPRRDVKSSLTASLAGASLSFGSCELQAEGAGVHVYSPSATRWFGPEGDHSTIYTTKYTEIPRSVLAMSLNMPGGRSSRAAVSPRAATPRQRPARSNWRTNAAINAQDVAKGMFLRPTSPVNVPRNYRFHPSSTPSSAARGRERSSTHMMSFSLPSPRDARARAVAGDEALQPLGAEAEGALPHAAHGSRSPPGGACGGGGTEVVRPAMNPLALPAGGLAASPPFTPTHAMAATVDTPLSWAIDDTASMVESPDEAQRGSAPCQTSSSTYNPRSPRSLADFLVREGLCKFCGQAHQMVEPILLQQAVVGSVADASQDQRSNGRREEMAEGPFGDPENTDGEEDCAMFTCGKQLAVDPSELVAADVQHPSGLTTQARESMSAQGDDGLEHAGRVEFDANHAIMREGQLEEEEEQEEKQKQQSRPPGDAGVKELAHPDMVTVQDSHLPPCNGGAVSEEAPRRLQSASAVQDMKHDRDHSGAHKQHPQSASLTTLPAHQVDGTPGDGGVKWQREAEAASKAAPGVTGQGQSTACMTTEAATEGLASDSVRDLLLAILRKDFSRRMLWTKGRQKVPRELLKDIRQNIKAVRKAAAKVVYDPRFSPATPARPQSALEPTRRPLSARSLASRPLSARQAECPPDEQVSRPHSARANGTSDAWWRSAASLSCDLYYTQSRIRGVGDRVATPLVCGQQYRPGGGVWGSPSSGANLTGRQNQTPSSTCCKDGKPLRRRRYVSTHHGGGIGAEVQSPKVTERCQMVKGRTMQGHASGIDRVRGLVAQKDIIREFARCW